ncbi:hypothetical protein BN77_2793 [Rhizobium mesoamericanum STM3625]|uniref:Uncharacterized protein n=1 Tax=Rhizobium mesoamericanum STM3625 TaxID=1211777 RepID=K0PZY5_9HYPH|nr:hypothetical protein BN77_2793 [Rhizobium mesoamericanum STM3625]
MCYLFTWQRLRGDFLAKARMLVITRPVTVADDTFSLPITLRPPDRDVIALITLQPGSGFGKVPATQTIKEPIRTPFETSNTTQQTPTSLCETPTACGAFHAGRKATNARKRAVQHRVQALHIEDGLHRGHARKPSRSRAWTPNWGLRPSPSKNLMQLSTSASLGVLAGETRRTTSPAASLGITGLQVLPMEQQEFHISFVGF